MESGRKGTRLHPERADIIPFWGPLTFGVHESKVGAKGLEPLTFSV